MPAAEVERPAPLDPLQTRNFGYRDSNEAAQSSALQSRSPSSTPSVADRRRAAFKIPPAVPSPPPLHSRYQPPTQAHHKPRSEADDMATDADTEQWLFDDYEIEHTPSVKHGLTPQEERSRRAKGANFIMAAAIILKLPQLTIGTACCFLNRFFMRKSMVVERGGFHHYNIAATALFLAAKSEENCRKTKDVVVAVAKVAQHNASLIIDEQSKEFWRWRDNILMHEEIMLEYLSFDLMLVTPYKYLFQYLQELEIDTNKPLRNAAWAFLNDSCLTTLWIMMPAKQLAVCALFFASRYSKERIPDDDGTAWWERIGGKPENMTKSIDVMYRFYTENPLLKVHLPHKKSPRPSDDLDCTRLKKADGTENGTSSPTPGERAEALERERADPIADEARGHTGAYDIKADSSDVEHEEKTNGKHEGEGSEEAIVADEGDGSSDAKLKEHANDPATHEQVGSNGTEPPRLEDSSKSNGQSANLTANLTTGLKRNSPESPEAEPEAKKAKLENGHGEGEAKKHESQAKKEESEEGEAEE